MRRDPKLYLYDIQQAISAIREFTAGKTLADYQNALMMRSAVERQVVIIAEALRKLSDLDKEIIADIRWYKRIIAFRNIIIHQYTDVDDQLVWETLEAYLPALASDVKVLLEKD